MKHQIPIICLTAALVVAEIGIVILAKGGVTTGGGDLGSIGVACVAGITGLVGIGIKRPE